MSVKKEYSKLGGPVAFSGRSKIKQYFHGKATSGEVDKQLEQIDTYTTKRQAKRVSVHNPYFVWDKRKLMQADLIDFTVDLKLVAANGGVRYLFCMIDTLTRFLFVRPMKTKAAPDVITAFKSILSESKSFQRLLTDRGGEWANKKWAKLMSDLKINHIYAADHAYTVERVQGSLQNIIYRYMHNNKTLKFVDVLDKLVKTYNSRYHRMIKMSPQNAEKPAFLRKLITNVRENYDKIGRKKKRAQFAEGDTVKISRDRGTFGRGYKDIFTKELFIIHKVNTRKPIPMYTIRDFHGEIIEGNFYSQEMQKVSEITPILSISRKKKKINAKTYVLVRWEDGGEDWVDEDQIADITIAPQ
jgi:hypothetical protein